MMPNSFNFLLFFLAALVVYYVLPHRTRWGFLLLASYWFYASWQPAYTILLALVTLICYLCGIGMDRAQRPAGRRAWLGAGLVTCVGLLVAFKYADFLFGSFNAAVGSLGIFPTLPALKWLQPVGLSFFTFQSLAYLFDVYRRVVPAERHLGYFALFVSFFPQILAGPINRAALLMPQLRVRQVIRYENIRAGLQLILWGLFKKMCIADLVAPVVDNIYRAPSEFSGALLALGTFFFAIQIYCDFSGYSDIAIGIGRMMGLELMTNFRQPYFSRSVGEFWKRWHISLSSWFRDYLYIPMGGSRVNQLRWSFNIVVVFLVSGLWHGANWTFVLWGLFHGIYLLVGSLTGEARQRFASILRLDRLPRIHAAWQTLIVFVLVTIAWVFFKANSVADAGYILTHMHDWSGFRLSSYFALGLQKFEMLRMVPLIVILLFVDWLIWLQPKPVMALWSARWFRWSCYTACFWAIVFMGIFERIQFIYFQF